METSFSKLFKRTPDYSFLRVFGYRCFPCLKDHGKNKFAKKAYPCIFVFDYSPIHKGYRCLDPKSNKIYISRYVVFDENMFPCAPNSNSMSQETLELTSFLEQEA